MTETLTDPFCGAGGSGQGADVDTWPAGLRVREFPPAAIAGVR